MRFKDLLIQFYSHYTPVAITPPSLISLVLLWFLQNVIFLIYFYVQLYNYIFPPLQDFCLATNILLIVDAGTTTMPKWYPVACEPIYLPSIRAPTHAPDCRLQVTHNAYRNATKVAYFYLVPPWVLWWGAGVGQALHRLPDFGKSRPVSLSNQLVTMSERNW